MKNFIVSARKYRPTTFEKVVGQKSITQTLKNAIINNHLGQSFLFCGPRGVGKTTCARILAKTINCFAVNKKTEACNNCESCTSFIEQHSFNIYELDAASNNSVEDIRNLVDQVRIPPQVGDRKIYIIDEVHMLSQAAFNAFLKTLEEPPTHAVFILATTEKHKIIPTILSRCQIFDFKRIKAEDISKHLAEICLNEKIKFEADALHIIGQKADGALRDGLSIFDRMVSFNHKKISYKETIENLNILDYEYYFKAVNHTLENDIPSVLVLFDKVLQKGFDGHDFMNGLAEHLRNVLVCINPKTISLLEVGEKIKEQYKLQAKNCNSDFIIAALEICNDYDVQYKTSMNQRLLVELSLMQICSLSFKEEKKKRKKFILNHNQNPTSFSKKLSSSNNLVIDKITSNSAQKSSENLTSAKIILKKGNADIISKIKKSRVGNLSINEFLNKVNTEEKKEIIPLIGESRTKFNQKELNKLWIEYAKIIEKKGKVSLFKLFSGQYPEIGTDFTLHFPLESQALAEDLKNEIPGLLSFLRKSLNNYGIQIDFPVLKSDETKILYTQEDKFKHMITKNPKLIFLKNTLGLEL